MPIIAAANPSRFSCWGGGDGTAVLDSYGSACVTGPTWLDRPWVPDFLLLSLVCLRVSLGFLGLSVSGSLFLCTKTSLNVASSDPEPAPNGLKYRSGGASTITGRIYETSPEVQDLTAQKEQAESDREQKAVNKSKKLQSKAAPPQVGPTTASTASHEPGKAKSKS